MNEGRRSYRRLNNGFPGSFEGQDIVKCVWNVVDGVYDGALEFLEDASGDISVRDRLGVDEEMRGVVSGEDVLLGSEHPGMAAKATMREVCLDEPNAWQVVHGNVIDQAGLMGTTGGIKDGDFTSNESLQNGGPTVG